MILTIIDYSKEYGFFVGRGLKFNSENELIKFLKNQTNIKDIEIITDDETLIKRLILIVKFNKNNIRRRKEFFHPKVESFESQYLAEKRNV